MVLSPLDIHNKDFSTRLRGYDQDEVNEFLEQIIKDYEQTLKEKKALEIELKASTEKVEYFNELKDALNQSIIVAQDAADKVKDNSKKEAENITVEAQNAADSMLSEATDKSNRMIADAAEKAKQLTIGTDELQKQTRVFRQKLQILLDTQVQLVKGQEWDDILDNQDAVSTETLKEIYGSELDNLALGAVKSAHEEPKTEEPVVVFSEDEEPDLVNIKTNED